MELFRIDDFSVVNHWTMMILGYEALCLVSSDRTTPRIAIYGLKDIDELSEKIRENALKERERRGVKTWAQA